MQAHIALVTLRNPTARTRPPGESLLKKRYPFASTPVDPRSDTVIDGTFDYLALVVFSSGWPIQFTLRNEAMAPMLLKKTGGILITENKHHYIAITESEAQE